MQQQCTQQQLERCMPQCHLQHGLTSAGCLQAGITSGALASAAVGAINVLGTVIAGSLMDKAGRKQLLTLSFAGELLGRIKPAFKYFG